MAKKSASNKRKIIKLKKTVNAKVNGFKAGAEKNANKAIETGSQKVDSWVADGEKEYAVISKDLERGKAQLDKEMKKRGLDYNEVGGIIAIVVGVFLILMNLTGLVLGIAGFFLIFFGLKMLGHPIQIKK